MSLIELQPASAGNLNIAQAQATTADWLQSARPTGMVAQSLLHLLVLIKSI